MKRTFVLAIIVAVLLLIGVSPAIALDNVLHFPSAIQQIKDSAFFSNTSLGEVVLPSGIQTIGSKAFANSSLQKINLPFTLTHIADDAFADCAALVATVQADTYASEWCKAHSIRLTERQDTIESAHPYADNVDYTWAYTQVGGKVNSLTLSFSTQTKVEKGRDFIYLYDGGDRLLGQYTGTELSGQSVRVDGDTFKIRLVSNNAVGRPNTHYGFKISKIAQEKETPLAFEKITCSQAQLQVGDTEAWTVETTGGKGSVYYDYTITLAARTLRKGTVARPENICFVPLETGDYTMQVTTRDSAGNTLAPQTSVICAVERTALTPIEDFTYAPINGVNAKITGYTGNDSVVTLPEKVTIGGIEYSLSQLDADVFSNNHTLTCVIFPKSYTAIGQYAFSCCDGLTRVILPDSIETLGNGVFQFCDQL
ncbi:MAG: leucine-rich repeat domain-containing protein, partial [Clostridia bacterium]